MNLRLWIEYRGSEELRFVLSELIVIRRTKMWSRGFWNVLYIRRGEMEYAVD